MAKPQARRALDAKRVEQTLMVARGAGLIAQAAVDETMRIFRRAHPLGFLMPLADSLHVHLKVDDTAAAPRARLARAGGVVENEKPGYVKFAFASGMNIILSSIDVAQDDLVPGLAKLAKPFLDHIGIDLRREVAEVREAFDRVPEVVKRIGWGLASQGGQGRPVFCCHVQVGRKHWAYPLPGKRRAAQARPIEIAFGPLKVDPTVSGCDLRPIDPSHPAAGRVPDCGSHCESPSTAKPTTTGRDGYYNRADLARFAEVGRFATPLMDKFFAYYTAVTATDGALTRREKALIALAVAHAKQCPYCIDAYTTTCLDTGSTPEQMHEAVHVAAALGAGIDLVHGVQMQNALREKQRI